MTDKKKITKEQQLDLLILHEKDLVVRRDKAREQMVKFNAKSLYKKLIEVNNLDIELNECRSEIYKIIEKESIYIHPELKRIVESEREQTQRISGALSSLDRCLTEERIKDVSDFSFILGYYYANSIENKLSDLKMLIMIDTRIKGTKARKEGAQEKHNLIIKALDDLYKHGEGYKMSYQQICNMFKNKKISTYTPKTTLKLIKKHAPLIKKKYK